MAPERDGAVERIAGQQGAVDQLPGHVVLDVTPRLTLLEGRPGPLAGASGRSRLAAPDRRQDLQRVRAPDAVHGERSVD